MVLLPHVVNESENVVVNQVVEEVNPPVEVVFDISRTSPEPNYSDNQGKPRMHLNLPCVLQIYIAFAFKYCIKWLGVEWKPNRTWVRFEKEFDMKFMISIWIMSALYMIFMKI